MLFQLSGRGCDSIREPATSRRFVTEICELLTRLDYAIDISCNIKPSEFANHRSHKAFRTVSFISSDSGETVYVGSPKSDRFVRVYRYNPPHPRSHLLRIEFVFRRGMARAAAREYCEQESDAHFLAKLGNTYGWAHPIWQPTVQTDERIATPVLKQSDENTVYWLYKQVLPAMQRLWREGALDVTDFLEKVFEEPQNA
jgi:DNA relaxase NicK